jgi:hypothetical protein
MYSFFLFFIFFNSLKDAQKKKEKKETIENKGAFFTGGFFYCHPIGYPTETMV